MPPDAPGLSLYGYLVPIAVVVAVVLLRNSRPRRLKVERLWLIPVVYLVFFGIALIAAPPPLSALSIAILVGGLLVGAAIGWQRGRFMRIDIHPETHDLTSRASPLGILFILAIFLLRFAARDLLAGSANTLHVPVIAIGYGFIALAVAMLSAQRLEVWLRASRLLAEAQGGAPPRPPSDLVR